MSKLIQQTLLIIICAGSGSFLFSGANHSREKNLAALEEQTNDLFDRVIKEVEQDELNNKLISAIHTADDPTPIKLLLEQCANPNAQNKGSLPWQPLHYAADCGRIEIIACLLEHNANIDYCDNLGTSAYHTALQAKHRRCAVYLREQNAEVHTQNLSGITPFDTAASNDLHNEVVALIERGYDPYHTKKDGTRLFDTLSPDMQNNIQKYMKLLQATQSHGKRAKQSDQPDE